MISSSKNQLKQDIGYGRSLLDENLKSVYDILAKAELNGIENVEIPLTNDEDLKLILTYIQRDHPELYYLDPKRYYYSHNKLFKKTTVTLIYKKGSHKTYDEQIEDAAAKFLQNISPSLSEFDKAVIVHDRLVQAVSYDLKAPRQDQITGVLCDKRATCEGYAKAYQYLLHKLGIEALIVYGDADGPHAWNIVRLNGIYYHADITWDDAMLDDGTKYISHDYLFLNDDYFLKNHTPQNNDINYPLPKCKSMKQNYFVKNDIVFSSTYNNEINQKLEKALNLAVSNKNNAVQIRFQDPTLAKDFNSSLINNGILDNLIQKKAKHKNTQATGHLTSKDGLILTYIIKYTD